MNNQDVSVEAGAGQFVWFPNARHTLAERPGQRYELRTEAQLIDAIRNPMQVPKEDADCYMVSSYNGHDARTHEAQRLHGHMGALWFDADQGNVSAAELHAKLTQALGPCRIHAWATASSTPQAMRSRACVMLDRAIPGEWYSTATGAFIMILLNQHGILLDGCAKREGQLMFGPNRGEHYDFVVGEGAPLDPFSFPGFEHLLRDCKKRYEQYLKGKANGGQYQARNDGGLISLANKYFSQDPDAFMERFGFEAEDALGIDWHHQSQSSESFATRLFQNDDGSYGWFTLSHTLAASGIRSNPHGATTAAGDLFAIYRWGNGLPDTRWGNQRASFLFHGEQRFGRNPPQFPTLGDWIDYLQAKARAIPFIARLHRETEEERQELMAATDRIVSALRKGQ